MRLLVFAALGFVLSGCSAASQAPDAVARPTDPATASCHVRDTTVGQLPDPVCTPGAIDPSVTQGNIRVTICTSGYSAKVRPPTSFTEPLKLKSMQEYGDGQQPASAFEYDHLISLELGGAPRDTRNLWAEPGSSPNKKDAIENKLHALVCSGQMTLADAQQRIATDWTTALP